MESAFRWRPAEGSTTANPAGRSAFGSAAPVTFEIFTFFALIYQKFYDSEIGTNVSFFETNVFCLIQFSPCFDPLIY